LLVSISSPKEFHPWIEQYRNSIRIVKPVNLQV